MSIHHQNLNCYFIDS